MESVNVNAASPWQLAVLLDLTRPEVEKLLLARPFANAEAFRQALPVRLAQTPMGLELPKRDINTGTDVELVEATGITLDVARRIVNARPFFFTSQIRALVGEAILSQIQPLFAAPELEYVDKLTNRSVTLTADPSRVLITKKDSESVSEVVLRRKLQPMFPHAKGSLYEVLAIPETEEATNILSELQNRYGRNVLPAYRDAHADFRYLDPKFCIIQFASGVSQQRQEKIISDLGLRIEERHRTPGLYTLLLPEAQTDPSALMRVLQALNEQPDIKFAEPNYLGFDDLEPLRPPIPASLLVADAEDVASIPWNLSLVHASEAWAIERGSADVIIAIIDTGVDKSHPALQGSLLSPGPNDNWNFASDNQELTDDDGHGTFIAGILVGNGTMGIKGLCPGCRVLPLKVPLSGEVTSYARRRDAILYALEKVPIGKHLIINLSWKTEGDIALIRDAISTAAARGALVITSAGNSPSRENEPHYPSDYPEAISVAAVGPNRQRADYSFYGDQVDISAPGGDEKNPNGGIRSAAPNNSITTGWGTSFAAPHVAGIAALVASANASLTAPALRLAVESSASPLQEAGMGRGLADAASALSGALIQRNDGPLQIINSADVASLISRFGLLPYTARLIAARRPFVKIEQIHGISGLTEAQYALIEKTL